MQQGVASSGIQSLFVVRAPPTTTHCQATPPKWRTYFVTRSCHWSTYLTPDTLSPLDLRPVTGGSFDTSIVGLIPPRMDPRNLMWASALVALIAIVTVRGSDVIAISYLPEVGHHSDIYIYAIYPMGGAGEIEIGKDGGLPSHAVRFGTISLDSPILGCYLRVGESNRWKGMRYGRYTANFLPEGPESSPLVTETFVKPKSEILDTGGVYTVTIYPLAYGETTLAEPVSIGVRWSPGCYTITWCKGRKRLDHSGPRLRLTSTLQAGLYTISRPGRGKRYWCVQIRVIAASCPKYFFLERTTDSATCQRGRQCKNGGVLTDDGDDCICPPFYFGDDCERVLFCPHGWSFFDGYCYYINTQELDWMDAEDACQSMDGHLASIHSEREDDFVFGLAGSCSTHVVPWIGLEDIDADGEDLQYSDGTQVDYTNFPPSNPDGGTECVWLDQGDVVWRRVTCTTTLHSVCKQAASPRFAIYADPTAEVLCGDLPGDNHKCKGYLICRGNNYGCKCAPGWWGNACDRPCRKGKYGANCGETCPNYETDCNRFFGPSSNGEQMSECT